MKRWVPVFLILATGRYSATPPAEPKILPSSDLEKAVNDYVEFQVSGGFGLGYVVIDNAYYDWLHRDEILNTLEIVKIDTLEDRAAVFVRWTVGTNIFREGYMFRNVEGVWALTYDREIYFSDHDKEEWQNDPRALFDKELQDWGEETSSRFGDE